MDEPMTSIAHGHCDDRPTVTFPAAQRHRPLAGTKLYSLLTATQGCEQLAQSRYTQPQDVAKTIIGQCETKFSKRDQVTL